MGSTVANNGQLWGMALRQTIAGDYVVDSPSPINLSYFWGFGSLLGLTLILLVATGISLAMHYTANTELALLSVENIMRSVNLGWLLRYGHANLASLFFIFVYLHVGRNLFYGSYKQPRALLWIIGVVIFIVMMATAFIGYVLPWGQMSLWGATVITNLLSAVPLIGHELVLFIWGGFSVDNATLNRFFALHYLLPFLLIALVILHLMALHANGSNNPLGIASLVNRIRFHPYFTTKDLVGFMWAALFIGAIIFYAPNYFGHPDNSIPANPLVTPHSIVPEWYFLPFYAILRAIPSKAGGVLAMGAALLAFIPLPFLSNSSRSNRFRPGHQLLFWPFVANFLFLLSLGSQPIAQPFILLGQLSTVAYFTLLALIALPPYY
jgi:quinol-cytochrome oxidoreductase complex cytochrome b subunit